jgi:hypothetical protein
MSEVGQQANWKAWFFRISMHKRFKSLMIVFLLAVVSHQPGFASFSFDSIANLTPGEQYRQLSLLLLVSGGTHPGLLDELQPLRTRQAAEAMQPGLELDDYVTPLVRIVDQEAMLANAAQMIQFARENGTEIQARLTRIATDNPILISMVDVNEIAADAIIIRNSIADSIEYSGVINDPAAETYVQSFRGQTVYLRNMIEYNVFQEELAVITNEAIVDLGGRLDAYQRMFDDEVDPDLIRRRVESAEIMNQQTGDRYQEQALMRNQELLMMLILMESQVY